MAAFQSGSIHLKEKSTTQANADVGWLRVYAKSDGSIYRKDENGVEYRFIGDTEVASISAGLETITLNGLDTTLNYSGNTLSSLSNSKGTKTFNYDINGNLVSISGTGEYTSKSFTYDINGNLIGIDVI
jgi:hypothetical protein